tara:strand:+ start:436 stop:603 length:168 start_codon:yes stop_codon:yes gene_type:complete
MTEHCIAGSMAVFFIDSFEMIDAIDDQCALHALVVPSPVVEQLACKPWRLSSFES